MPRPSLRKPGKAEGGEPADGAAKASVTKRKANDELDGIEEPEEIEEESKPTKRRKTRVKAEEEEEEEEPAADQPPARKPQRKAGKGKSQDAMALAPRTPIDALKKLMYIGAHVSAAGGVQSSIPNAVHIGANAFALFLKSQRKWTNPPLAKDALDGFRTLSHEHKYDVHKHCLPHGSYLINLAQADKTKAAQAYTSFLDDLERCESLGIKLYNFHPGSANGGPRVEAIWRIAKKINNAHKATKTVVTVLENMAGQGTVIGATFEDLRDIIRLIKNKDRIGVCIDTCHAFAAGYDLRSPEAFQETMKQFNKVVGARYLKALHLNDSKRPLGSQRDLHANIGTGFLGLRAFHNVVNYDGFAGLPMILETPIDRKTPDGKTFEDKQVWADEIKLLERLIGMDPDSAEFAALEADLSAPGRAERDRIQEEAVLKAHNALAAEVKAKAAADKKKAAKARRRKKASS
ncbi:DNA lyase [Durotheca rogersii]|uniref:DNA lyase n=1 Tax=Durotheca rogersii TaxID=419775 RepID=UPI00221FEB1C|nr:DNA lyase [Durotheca rogersii]KAI5862109.1 DNA lyase [Durotheca rogersii]